MTSLSRILAVSQILLYGLLLALPVASAAQQKQPPPTPPPASPSPAPAASQVSSPQANTATYDPVSAEQDIEVGNFYMRKGDIDAAIIRFKDAIRLRSNFAKPRLLLAEAYEKKKDKASAVKYYKEYLQVFPDAPDAKKIGKRIDSLLAE
jgi:tetratricopeptide (TPR) repeat protein